MQEQFNPPEQNYTYHRRLRDHLKRPKMSESTYGNIIIVRAQEMDKEDGEETDKEDGEEMIIYGNADIIKSHNVCIRPQDIRRNQTSQQTGRRLRA